MRTPHRNVLVGFILCLLAWLGLYVWSAAVCWHFFGWFSLVIACWLTVTATLSAILLSLLLAILWWVARNLWELRP